LRLSSPSYFWGNSSWFWHFSGYGKKARRGVNPQTGKTIQIPAKKVPKFKPGKGLREKVK